jgi:hypothetical protein
MINGQMLDCVQSFEINAAIHEVTTTTVTMTILQENIETAKDGDLTVFNVITDQQVSDANVLYSTINGKNKEERAAAKALLKEKK